MEHGKNSKPQRVNNNRKRKSPTKPVAAPPAKRQKTSSIRGDFGRDTQRAVDYVRSIPNGGRDRAAAKQAILAIAAPGETSAFRWSSEFNDQPTAVGQPWRRFPVGFCRGATPTGRSFDRSETMAILKRNPTCSIIHYDANPNNTPWRYAMTMSYLNPAVSTHNAGTVANYNFIEDESHPITWISGSPTLTYKPHGNLWFAGAAGGDLRFFWLGLNDQVSLKIRNLSTETLKYQLTAWFYDERTGLQSIAVQLSNDVAFNGIYTLNNWSPFSGVTGSVGGYVALSVAVLKPFATVASHRAEIFDVFIAGSNEVFCHLPVPTFDTSFASYDSVRITGAACMFSNRATVMGLQGSCYGAQIGGGKPWQGFIGKVDSIMSVNGCIEMDAAKGIYGFLKPTSPDDFAMESHIRVSEDNTLMDSFWPIVSQRDFIVLYLKINNTAESQNGLWSFFYNVEFRTTNTIFSLDFPTADQATIADALADVKFMKQFHENPLHIKELVAQARSLARGAVRSVSRYGPQVLSTVQRYGPQAVQLASALAKVL